MINKLTSMAAHYARSLAILATLILTALDDPTVNVKMARTENARAESAETRGECKEALRKATKLFAENQDAEALKVLREHQDKCRDSAQFNIVLSTILIRMKNHEKEAAEAAATAVRLNPGSVAANMQYAVCLLISGQREKAIGAFEQLVKIDPANYEAWSALGTLYCDLGENEKSKKCAGKAACLEPDSRTARVRTAWNLFKAGKRNAVVAELNRLIGDDDLEPEFFIPLAREAISMTCYAEAVRAANKALSAYPNSVDLIKTKALAHLWGREYQEGWNTISALDAPISSKSKRKRDSTENTSINDDVEVAAIKALLLMHLGRTAEAKPFVLKLPARTENLPVASLAKAMAFERSGETDAAVKELFISLKNDQLFAPARIELARIYIRQGKDEDALCEAHEIARTKFYASASKAMESRLALEQAPLKEKMEEALQLARQAVKADENDPEALTALTMCELRAGHLDPSRDLIKKALEIDPGNVDAALAQAKLFESEGNKAKRLETLKAAFDMALGDSEVLTAYAQAYIDEGDNETALDILKQNISNHQTDALLNFSLARAYERSGQSKEAVKYFKQSLSQGLKGSRATLAKEALKQLGENI